MNTFKVFLAGLALDFTKEELFDFFSYQYDSIVSIHLVKQTHTRTKTANKGSGFMQLTDLAEVLDLLRREKFCLNGRNFLVKKFKEGAELEQFKKELVSRRIFVHKIGPTLTNQHLIRFFSRIVNIEDAYIINPERKEMLDRMEQQRGSYKGRKPLSKKRFRYGYLVLKNAEDADYLLSVKSFRIKNSYVILEKYKTPKSNNQNEKQEQNQFNSKQYQRDFKGRNQFQKAKNNYFNSKLRRGGQTHKNNYRSGMSRSEPNHMASVLAQGQQIGFERQISHGDEFGRERVQIEEKHQYSWTNQQRMGAGRHYPKNSRNRILEEKSQKNKIFKRHKNKGVHFCVEGSLLSNLNHAGTWKRPIQHRDPQEQRRSSDGLSGLQQYPQKPFYTYLDKNHLKSRHELTPVENYLALLQDPNLEQRDSFASSSQRNHPGNRSGAIEKPLQNEFWKNEKRVKIYRLDLPEGHEDLFNNFLTTSKVESNHLLPNLKFSKTKF